MVTKKQQWSKKNKSWNAALIVQYSGDLNNGLVWYSKGWKLFNIWSSLWMPFEYQTQFVWYSNHYLNTRHLNTRHLNTGQVKVGYSDVVFIHLFVTQFLFAIDDFVWYSGDLNSELVRYLNGPKQLINWMVHYSGHGLNTTLIVCYIGHDLNNELLPGIWIANKWKLVIQMFTIQMPTVHLKNNDKPWAECIKFRWR